MNPPGFAPAHGSVPFGLESTVARRIGAGGRCGASKTNPSNMLDMPSMKDETARMTTTTPEVRIHDTAQPEILAALAREARWWKYSSCEHVFHCIRLWDCWVGVAGDGDNGCYEYFVWKDGKLTTSDVGYGCTDTALRDVLKEVVQ